MLSNAQQTFSGPSYPFPPRDISTDSSHSHPSSGYDVGNGHEYSSESQELSAPWNVKSAHEGLYYQPLNCDLEQELLNNYLNLPGDLPDSFLHDSQIAVPSSGYYAPLATHPSVSSVTSTEVYDMSLRNSMSQQELTGHIYESHVHRPENTSAQLYSHPAPAPFAHPSQAGGVASSHITSFPQSVPSHPVPENHHLHRRSPRAASTSPYPSPSPEPQQSGELTTYKRRNVQVPVAGNAVATTSSSSSSTGSPEMNKWQCPFCPHVQHNRRSPDFRRHLETHTSPEESSRWVCCGVPYSHARALGVPEEVVREEAFEFMGMYMVGGCRKTFSRRDALSRHLRRAAGECYGNAFAAYQPGNMSSAPAGMY